MSNCYVHPDVDAVGICSECNRYVCAECAAIVDDKMMCMACSEKKVASMANAAAAPASLQNPMLNAILSFLFPGVGQYMNKQQNKAIVHAVLSIFLRLLLLVPYIRCIAFIFHLAITIWSAYDAYTVAEKLNKGEAVPDNLI